MCHFYYLRDTLTKLNFKYEKIFYCYGFMPVCLIYERKRHYRLCGRSVTGCNYSSLKNERLFK